MLKIMIKTPEKKKNQDLNVQRHNMQYAKGKH